MGKYMAHIADGKAPYVGYWDDLRSAILVRLRRDGWSWSRIKEMSPSVDDWCFFCYAKCIEPVSKWPDIAVELNIRCTSGLTEVDVQAVEKDQAILLFRAGCLREVWEVVEFIKDGLYHGRSLADIGRAMYDIFHW